MTLDVDIVLFGERLTLEDLSQLTERMEQLSMPQRVDLVLYQRIDNENLVKHIQEYGVDWI